MKAYSDFAAIYDELMTDIPYDSYVDFLDLALGGLEGKRVLDIGCGTGLLSLKFAGHGSEVTGIDVSANMLEMAKERAATLSLPVEFIQQRMEELEGFQQFDAAIIAIDSLNYVTQQSAVEETFRRIYASLKKGGILLFDVHSTYKMDEIFLEGPFTYDDGRIAYIWETEMGEAPHSIQSELAFFVEQEKGLYHRFNEEHEQRTFPVNEYVEMLTDAGFSIERIFADWEDEPPVEDSERIFFQVRK
ncbi:methyltransferase [Bacillus sp. OxB-1]|uniref:class I SAM-dependent DNA methyltransferase n=1 Tax=Bacillus sp. (strain OxB-1) TaxID=98228 RepID=UPI000581FEF9|nr:methyltransferase [Bacillus sp. OxB-1]